MTASNDFSKHQKSADRMKSYYNVKSQIRSKSPLLKILRQNLIKQDYLPKIINQKKGQIDKIKAMKYKSPANMDMKDNDLTKDIKSVASTK